jgi:hypothetical protein
MELRRYLIDFYIDKKLSFLLQHRRNLPLEFRDDVWDALCKRLENGIHGVQEYHRCKYHGHVTHPIPDNVSKVSRKRKSEEPEDVEAKGNNETDPTIHGISMADASAIKTTNDE